MQTLHKIILVVLASLFIAYTSGGQAHAQTSLGMVGIRSIHGRFLQAHTDGEMHASNQSRNEEETWFLVSVDPAKHIFALLNWKNHMFLSKHANGVVRADSTVLTRSEQWFVVSGRPFVLNAVAFKSVADGTFIGSNPPGQDDPSGGEVSAHDPSNPQPTGAWPGYWVMEAADIPKEGRDFWNTVTGPLKQFVGEIKPADVAALIALVAASG